MTTPIEAAITLDARRYYAKFFGSRLATPGTPTNVVTPVWDPRWKCIRWGEGGWVDNGSGPVRRAPSSTLRRLTSPLIQDLDAAVDVTRSSGDQRYTTTRAVYQKSITPLTDVTDDDAGVVTVRAFLDFGEFNDNGAAAAPRIWEVGVFSDHPTITGQLLMVMYATIPLVTKTSGIQVERFLRGRF